MHEALEELKRTGDYTGMTEQAFVAARKAVEDTIGLEEYYEIERTTVEKRSRKPPRAKAKEKK
jgi:hypothetical protein